MKQIFADIRVLILSNLMCIQKALFILTTKIFIYINKKLNDQCDTIIKLLES